MTITATPVRGWVLDTGGRTITLDRPRCWEEVGVAKDVSGPFRYRTVLDPIRVEPGRRVLLRFGAVSYACVVRLDGEQVAEHRGSWDGFEIDVTDRLTDDQQHRLEVVVEKPASLTAGPDSPTVPGDHPTREVLAGFLPYVWGHLHGGIWQPVELITVDAVRVTDLAVRGTADGRISIDLETSESSAGRVVVLDPDGRQVAGSDFGAEHGAIDLQLEDPRPWSPAEPSLYTLEVTLSGGTDTVGRRFGLRTLTTDDHRLLLNGAPTYPRMILSWGWYPDLIAPDPGPERVRDDLLRLRDLGFNGVKLCLWMPPDCYFDIADELGMLVWLELPLWLPLPSPGFAEQATAEITALVRKARQHPSVIIYTLGCELGSAVDQRLLEQLYWHVKDLTNDALVCDNSGSGEAYGGADVAFTDFYDHHLYAEPEHLREIFDHFAPGWRPAMPWLMGEFCDLDAYRDLPDALPWWASRDPKINPQGARWQYDLPELPERLRRGGWSERGPELTRIGDHAALLHRKITCEYVRSRTDTSGYVITGERDTPISTAGILDDSGRVRVDAQAFADFNADTVLLYATERRRRWVSGGDRPAPSDPYCHVGGATVGLRVLIAHHGPGVPDARVDWSLQGEDGRTLSSGRLTGRDGTTGVYEVGHLQIELPDLVGPVRFVLQGSVADGDRTRPIQNSWTWWLLPDDPWSGLDLINLYDPTRRFDELAQLTDVVTGPIDRLEHDHPLVAGRWTPEVEAFVRSGGQAVVALDRAADAPMPLISEPFWRESLKVIEEHPWWQDFPHRGLVDLQFSAVAAELAMDTAGIGTAGVGDVEPLLRRVDARTGVTHDYAVRVPIGTGAALFTTLTFEGGRGSQPAGLRRNPAGRSLLAAWLKAARRARDRTIAD